MATLNTLACANDVGNTGVGGCFYDPKNMIGAFLVPKGSEVDIASLQASLIAKTHHVSPSQRWYPVYGFETTTDSTEEKTVQTMPTNITSIKYLINPNSTLTYLYAFIYKKTQRGETSLRI